MSGKKANQALMVAHGVGTPIALNAMGSAAEWIMLLPIGAGGVITTVDKRGPYRVRDAAKLATESLQAAGGRLPIDENHSTDLAAPQGGPSPARGWAVELEPRQDGIYGRVEWSAPGAALMAEKAYRFISPVIMHDAAFNVLTMPRASLVNTPNLRGMPALNAQENETETMNMDLLAQLRKLLGLPDTADEAAVLAKVKDMHGGSAVAMQSIAKAAGLKDDADATTVLNAVTTLKASSSISTSLQSIAKAAGLKEDADVTAITAAVTSLAAGKAVGESEAVKALQASLADVTTRLNTTTASIAKKEATTFVDNAIKEGRVGVKPLREHYISMHSIDPVRVEKEINAMPKLGPSGALQDPPPANKDGAIALNSEQSTAAKLLGIKPEDYAKTLASEQTAA